ncbi:MAG: SusE domain-containing protein, partial [Bacteroidales bacterium]|nr:SusE domain-containing protein [Bacteroidales bacterium]
MKFTKYFLSMAAAVGMIAGCQKTEMVQISAPEDVVAPVLNAVEDINITAANLGLESVTFEWSAADFGVKTQVNYAIEVASAGSADKVVVTSGVTGTSVVVPYESLNAILLYDLGLASGVAENVDFYVSAKVGEYAKVYSAPVTASATVTEAEKEYPKLFVVGSYNGWSHDKNQYLFDFAGEDKVYQGMIDFGADHASNEFKI